MSNESAPEPQLSSPSTRPNILLICTDQQFAGAMSCAGNSDLHTPAMDSLAATGVRFTRTYCTQPLCTPSRASLMTGLMPHQLGVAGNQAGIPAELRPHELGALLAAAGYHCAYGGKWHLPTMSMEADHGFHQTHPFGDADLAGFCADVIRQPRREPFFLVACFDNPHNICEWARNEPLPWGEVPRVPEEECPCLPANFAGMPDEPQLLNWVRGGQPGIHPTAGWSPGLWRHYRHAYYRLCEKVDAELGRILQALRDSGQEQNTVVIFTSDHGDGLGAHGWNQKWALWEEVVRVPLIVSWPGVTSAGEIDDEHLVSNGLDVLPTICDYAGVECPAHAPGANLRPLAEGRPPDTWRDALVTVTNWHAPWDERALRNARGRMLRTDRYKYVVYSWGQFREQLFDLQNDPGEMVNLASSARHRPLLLEHRSRLRQWCDEHSDDFPLPDSVD
jgi:arylsulfatase A-like enzyme